MGTILQVSEAFDRLRATCAPLRGEPIPPAAELLPADLWQSWNSAELTALSAALEAEWSGDFYAPDHAAQTAKLKPAFSRALSLGYCRLLGALFPPLPRADRGPSLGTPHAETVTAATNQLHTDGYCVWPERLADQACDAITRSLRHIRFRVRSSGQIMDGFCDRNIYRPAGSTCWVIDPQEILRIPEVQTLVCDPLLLNLVQAYLGCPPVHVRANCWWSINASDPAQAGDPSTQRFHQDQEFARSIKVFVYLNDVTEWNGPHVYLAGSPQDYEDHTPPGYCLTDRLSDEYIAEHYARERECVLTGPRGTLVLEDPHGFHKGMPIRCGYRLMLQLQYSCSLFFRAFPSFALRGLSPEFSAFATAHPRTFLNYDDARYLEERAGPAWRLDGADHPPRRIGATPWLARLRRWMHERRHH